MNMESALLYGSVTASDAVENVKGRENLSLVIVLVHLIKGNVGPGAMSLPSGFSKTGLYAGPILFVLVALVSTYNMDLLLRCKERVSPTTSLSFGDVGLEIFGPKGKLVVDLLLVGTQLGICCVYFTFVATNLYVLLPTSLQDVIHERHLILAIFPVFLALSWVQSLRRITPFSTLANVAVFAGILIVFYYSIEYWHHVETPATPNVNWTHVPEFYGTAVYSFEGIGLILPLQNAMAEPTRFPRVLALCMTAILLLFLAIGLIPTLAFGRIENGSMTAVLDDYDHGWLSITANLALAFACMLSFPIQFYPAIEILEQRRQDEANVLSKRLVFRSLVCTSLMLLAFCVPDVGLLISLFGSIGSSLLAIVLPPLLYLQAMGSTLTLSSRIFHSGIALFGFIGMIAGSVQTFRQVIHTLH